ncbi:MAG: hypothetical protein ACREEM_36895 [Blastocatellia bacterium]
MITLVKHPKRRKGLLVALVASVLVHAAAITYVRNASFFSLALGLREIEFVEEDYNRVILIDFSKKLKYPGGYLGFRPPEKVLSLEEQRKLKERRARLEAERRKKEEERRKREEEELARQREAEEKAKAEAAKAGEAEARQQDIAKAEAKPTPTPSPTPHPDGYGRFGKINTRPIKEQLQRLYDAKKEGKLALPEGRLRVGVEGTIASDGTIAKYRMSVPSGIPEIDEAAKAILDAVSESRALGALASLTSISMVLDIDQNAELRVIGFATTEQDAIDITNLAQVALLAARIKKAGEPAAMVMLNNLRIKRDGSRVNATITVPRQMASETLAKSMDKGDKEQK